MIRPLYKDTEFPLIVIAESKWDDYYFIVNNNDEIQSALINIYHTRDKEGFYETEIDDFNYETIRKFLNSRLHYEYENIQVIKPVRINP